ncbi:MAG: LamG domain-containing protein, partial [Planctomycetota bacterium]
MTSNNNSWRTLLRQFVKLLLGIVGCNFTGSRTMKYVLLSVCLVFVAFLVAYTASQNWYFGPPEAEPLPYDLDTTTNPISGLQNIEIITPTGVARLIQHPAYSYIHDTTAEYTGTVSNIAPYSDSDYMRLDRQPNGGFYSTGNFTSRVFDNTISQTWNSLQWTDNRVQLTTAESGMVGFWKLDGDVTESKSGRTTTNSGGLVTFASNPSDGVFQQCGTFKQSESDYINVTDHGDFDMVMGNFTIECWINTTNTASGQTIIHKAVRAAPDTQTGWELGINASDQKVFFSLYSDFTNPDSLIDEAVDTTVNSLQSITDGKWHHIVGFRSGSEISLYVDSVLQGRATQGDSDTTWNMDNGGVIDMQIGKPVSTTVTSYFDGRIDEVAVYQAQVLTENQIYTHYINGLSLKFRVRAAG